MRKIYTALLILCASTGVFAQSTFSDDFESYTLGAYIGQVSPNWTTWSGTTGGAEDAQAVNTAASSGTQSSYYVATSPGGGPQDVILPFGGQYTTGNFHYEMDMKVTSNMGAYFNFQANTVPGQLWALEIYLNHLGGYTVSNTSGTYLTGSYPTGTWFNIAFNINLNTNQWEMLIDNVSQGIFANAVNKIASIDIYGANPPAGGGNDQAEFWIDDVTYTHTPYVLPSLNAAVVAVGGINPATRAPGAATGLVGQSKVVAATVRNLGLTPITSFNLDYTYNGNAGSATVTGVNIASLASQTVSFATPITLVTGANALVATVSQVNGQGSDGDINDDMSSIGITITAVPAPGKMVVAEEGTGTWCQWCPRGAIYMDYMHDNYDPYFAGIAVHNNDPMKVAEYDSPFSQFLSGYPSVLVERGADIDPLDIESEFLTKIVVAPTAAIVNGATYDSNTRTLNVSQTYTFSGNADDTWRVMCVLTEDSVTGTIAGYNQSNAYGNNGAGPMGGFEMLGTSVPAAQMNYNHVARALSPNFVGATGFPAVVSSGAVHTFNFSFVLPATWDENEIYIVGMLIDNGGEIDNGSKTSIDEAIANGFVAGTTIVGVDQPDGPDALVSLYPNPTHGDASLDLNLATETEVQVTVSDLQGRKLSAQNYGILSGSQRISINSSSFAAGLYFVQVRMGDVVKTQRLVVE
jgi:Outer membrane protein Omp28/Secretion system C-terminal sorting domain